MMHIVNIDSSMDYLITPGIEVSLTKRLSFLGDKFWKTPFYLVNKKTMDCLYPPKKRMGLNEHRLRSMMQQKTAFKDILDECCEPPPN